ncbi:hypothetical protein FIBSPDRAFT_902798 [Athelia psychrophila]|uniref:Uncharacterized protein n=1 Tax=Athelia psychrophila TaxID=1759441 RepID=A0A167WTC4_9AGAM|nr:hypothetical protein FIBSPDRAFT_902798 [Fibularhizoctonia sp. CBS 109695]
MTSSTQSASSKRKRSSSPEISLQYRRETNKDTTSKLIKGSIAQLIAIPELPTSSFGPLLDTLHDAYKSAVLLEDPQSSYASQVRRIEDWNWQLAAEKVASMSARELELWKELVFCRKDLEDLDIHVNPAAWQDPMGDLFRWQAHIPGPKNVRLYFKHAFDVLIIGIFKTSWAGGVYTVNLIFDDNISDRLPKLKFIAPLCHPNCYPSGTWANSDNGMLRACQEGLYDNALSMWSKSIDERRLAKQLHLEEDTHIVLHTAALDPSLSLLILLPETAIPLLIR